MTIPSAAAAPGEPRHLSYGVIAAASIGNALEWFDILAYGYFAVVISKLFFPAADPTVSLMLALGTFGASYLIRPLGAIVLGTYADRAGRKAAMLVSIVLMMVGTFLMAIMPTYATIGVFAPLGILAARLIQGFAVAGEFGSATTFLAEHAPERKGYLASWQWSGQGLGNLLPSIFGVLLTTLLTTEQLQSWGWRVPFLFGLLVGPIGLYIRRHLEDAPEFRKAQPSSAPVSDVLARQTSRFFLALGVVVLSTSAQYLILFMPTYAIKQLHLPASVGFTATIVSGLILTIGAPIVGHWSDKIGRTRIMMATTLLFLFSVYPVFVLLTSHVSFAILVLMVGWMGLLKTTYSGALPALMTEIFPTQTRVTGVALSYNVGVPIFGGFAPLIITWMIHQTGSNLAPSYYMIFTALVSLGTLILIQRRLKLR
jgi:MHS family proline/betaine transporter-like MFS transporter